MNTARIVVLTVAIGAGGIAAYLASGSDNSAPPANAPVAQLPTVDVLVAKSDIGLGQTVKPEDVQWQTWPSASASATFIRRSERPDATTQVVGSIVRAPFMQGEPIRDQKLKHRDSIQLAHSVTFQFEDPRARASRRNLIILGAVLGAAVIAIASWLLMH